MIPDALVVAKFVIIYKNKGSSDDPSKYMCVPLLNHSYKILSQIILARMMDQSETSLQD